MRFRVRGIYPRISTFFYYIFIFVVHDRYALGEYKPGLHETLAARNSWFPAKAKPLAYLRRPAAREAPPAVVWSIRTFLLSSYYYFYFSLTCFPRLSPPRRNRLLTLELCLWREWIDLNLRLFFLSSDLTWLSCTSYINKNNMLNYRWKSHTKF